VTGEQVHSREVAGGDMSPQDILEFAVLIRMRRLGRRSDHPPPADDLVARNLGLNQALVHRREGPPARQVQRVAGGARSFKAVSWSVLTHARYNTRH